MVSCDVGSHSRTLIEPGSSAYECRRLLEALLNELLFDGASFVSSMLSQYSSMTMLPARVVVLVDDC